MHTELQLLVMKSKEKIDLGKMVPTIAIKIVEWYVLLKEYNFWKRTNS